MAIYQQNKQFRQKKSRKFPLIIVSVILLLGLAGGGYWFGVHKKAKSATKAVSSHSNETITYNPPTQQETQEAQDQKINNDPASDDKSDTTTPSQGTGSSTGSATSSSVSISESTFSNGSATIQTKLLGNGWRTCTLTLTQGSHSFTKTADVLYQPSFSTCMGFDIPASDFPTSGVWNVALSVTNSSSATGTAAAKVTVTK